VTSPAAQPVHGNRHVAQQGDNMDGFLRYARTRYYPVVGSIAAGQSGGTPASNVTFTSDIPVVPAWMKSMTFEVTLPINLTIPATSNVKVSPYFPYSAIIFGLTLAGSPPWDLITLTPWYLDEITASRGLDNAASGIVPGSEANQADAGPFVYSSSSFAPGTTITNGTGAPVVTSGTVTFRVRARFQRNPKLMFGCIPMGDPENRPRLNMQMSALVGPSPENNAFQDTAGAGATAVLSGAGTVNIVIDGLSLDVLPPGVQGIPTPIVGMGLAITYATQTQNAAGQFLKVKHSAAMLYEKVLHLLVNGQLGQRADYFGNWLTGEQQSARSEFDATQGTFNQWYERTLKRYRRYFPKGAYILDLNSAFDPDDPSRDLYEAHQTPDTGYAAEFGLPATPAWTTALRIPTGTAMSGAYVAVYEFGTVNVPY
jgi:hypothetical protein